MLEQLKRIAVDVVIFSAAVVVGLAGEVYDWAVEVNYPRRAEK